MLGVSPQLFPVGHARLVVVAEVHQVGPSTPWSRDESQPYPMEEDTRGEEWGADCSLGQFMQQPIP